MHSSIPVPIQRPPHQSQPKQSWREIFRSKRGKLALLGGAMVLIVAAAATSIYLRYYAAGTTVAQGTSSFLPSLTVAPGPTTVASKLDGTQVSEEKANRRPLAVMVENHPAARPQVGLTSASAVWEGIVEGGITRFMAIYGPRDAAKIGPIRSARTQYVSWAAGYHALYTHAGGAQGALALLPTLDEVVDLPHTAAYFQREPQPGLASEHTLFSSTEQLYEFAKAKEAALEGSFTPLSFQREPDLENRPAAAEVTIDFSSAEYAVHWVYDRTENVYKREMAGAMHLDRSSGDQITAKNIVVLTVARSLNPNTNGGKGEWSMTTEGTGKAKLFQNGTLHEGTWKKERKDSLLRVVTESGSELSLVPGTTWYEVVPPDREASVAHSETPVSTVN